MKSMYEIQEELKNKDLIAKYLAKQKKTNVKVEVIVKF